MTTIFDPIKLGDLELANRIIMAPLTRCRADEGRVPNALMAEYYVQRASAGLILSEATSVTPMGVGYPDTPGIWSNDQVRGWSNVTKAIHGAGGKIFLQLWHVGRISHGLYLNGEAPIAPSAIQPKGHVSLVRPLADFPVPRALETAEIADIVTFAVTQDVTRAEVVGLARGFPNQDVEFACHVPVVGDTPEPFMGGTDAGPLRMMDSMAILPQDPAAAVEEVLRRREEAGFTYFVIGGGSAEAFAPVVAELAGTVVRDGR